MSLYAPDPRDLTTLANFQYWTNLANVDAPDAQQQQRIITDISVWIQSFINRTIAVNSYSEIRDGNGGSKIVLPDYPVQSVTGVYVNGVPIPASISPVTPGWILINNAVQLRGYQFSRGIGNVDIEYTAGYPTTPPDLEQAVIELASLRWAERSRIGQVSKNIGGEVISFTQKDMSASVNTVLAQYRAVVPL